MTFRRLTRHPRHHVGVLGFTTHKPRHIVIIDTGGEVMREITLGDSPAQGRKGSATSLGLGCNLRPRIPPNQVQGHGRDERLQMGLGQPPVPRVVLH
jgi:hypothetical protein